jgi:hypothetical protein
VLVANESIILSNKTKYRQLHKTLIFIFFGLAGLTDIINGIFTRSGIELTLSIGQIVRGLLLFYLTFIIFSYSNVKGKIAHYVCVILLYFISHPIVIFLINHNMNELINNLITSSYILLSIISAIGLYTLLSCKIIDTNTTKKIIEWNIIIIPTSSIVSYFLNIASRTYSNSAGIKGLFISQNTLSIVLIVLFVFVCDKLFIDNININNVIQFCITGIAAVLVGTKTTLVFIPIITIFYIFISLKNRRIKVIAFGSIAVIIGIIIIQYLFKDELTLIIARQKYFIDSLVRQNNDIFTYLVSGRDNFLRAEFINFVDKFSLGRLIFGIGEYAKNVEIASGMSLKAGYKMIEMDPFDLFFGYGLLGFVLIFYFYIRLLVGIIRTHAYKSREMLPYVIALLCMFIYSTFGGHVLYGALPSIFLGVISSRLLYFIYETSKLNLSAKNNLRGL